VNRELAQKVAKAVLYEGYMLYPYRPSAIKNRQRWSFGILYPATYREVVEGTERSTMHSECLLQSQADASVQIQLSFLQLVARGTSPSVEGREQPIPSLVNGQPAESSDEGVERSVYLDLEVKSLIAAPRQVAFDFAARRDADSSRDSNGIVAGAATRVQHALTGTVSARAAKIGEDLCKLIVDISNTTALAGDDKDRDPALLHSLLSAHTILTVAGGEFVSLLDPADTLREAAASCKNIGNFPVLVGNEGERDMLLCSPIMLYDYPQIAPESAGDFYDATEMDEMLTLRVMTLTDNEKNEMRLADDHVRELLQRTEQTAREQLMKTHGTIRSMRPVNEKP
jgi:hypothetical protein